MFENIKKLLKRDDGIIPLPAGYDSEIFNQVLMRSISSEQQTAVLRTSYHLSQLWCAGDTEEIPRAITMVDAAYPHLERMADLVLFSEEWLDELNTVIQITSNSAEVSLYYPEQFKQLLHDALENLQPEKIERGHEPRNQST